MSDKREYAKAYRVANKVMLQDKRKAHDSANKVKLAAKRKDYYATNKDKIEEQRKDYRAANKDKIAERNKNYRAANKDKITAYRSDVCHKRVYGITLEESILQFGTACNNCGHTPGEDDTLLRTDHCHDTGKVRGRLCNRCNVGIGQLGDTIEGLESAIRYLQRSEKT